MNYAIYGKLKQTKKIYDFRLKAAIYKSKEITLFPHLGMPKTTASNWITNSPTEYVTTKVLVKAGD